MAVFQPNNGQAMPPAPAGAPAFGGGGTEATGKLKLDFSNVGKVVPPGQYLLEVKSQVVKTSRNNNQYLQITYNVVLPEELASALVFDRLMLEGGGLARTRAALIAFGYQIDDPQFEFDPETLLKKTVWVEVINEADQQSGQMRANISKYIGS